MQQIRKHYKVWEAENPVLASAEIGVAFGFDNDIQRQKIGNGVSKWNDLPYQPFAATPYFTSLAELQDYAGIEQIAYVEGFGEYRKEASVGLMLLDNNVVVFAKGGGFWVKNLKGVVNLEDFGGKPDFRYLMTRKEIVVTYVEPVLAGDSIQDTATTLTVTSGTIRKRDYIEAFRLDGANETFLSVDRAVVSGDNTIKAYFRNTGNSATTGGATRTMRLIAWEPVVECLGAGQFLLPTALISSADIGKRVMVEESYLNGFPTDATFMSNKSIGVEVNSCWTISNVVNNGNGTSTITVLDESGSVQNVTSAMLRKAYVFSDNFDALTQFNRYKEAFDVDVSIKLTGYYGLDPYNDRNSASVPLTEIDAGVVLNMDRNIKIEGTFENTGFVFAYEDTSFYVRGITPTTNGQFNTPRRWPNGVIVRGKNGSLELKDFQILCGFRGTRMTEEGPRMIYQLPAAGYAKGKMRLEGVTTGNTYWAEGYDFTNIGSTAHNLQTVNGSGEGYLFEEINCRFNYTRSGNTLFVQAAPTLKRICKNVDINVNPFLERTAIDAIIRLGAFGADPSILENGTQRSLTSYLGNIDREAKIIITAGSNTITLVSDYFTFYDFVGTRAGYVWSTANGRAMSVIQIASGQWVRISNITSPTTATITANAAFSTAAGGEVFYIQFSASHYIYSQGAYSCDFENYRQLGYGATFRFEGSSQRPGLALFRRFKNCVIRQGGIRVDEAGGRNDVALWEFVDSVVVHNQSPLRAKYIRTDSRGSTNGGEFTDCNFTGINITNEATLNGCSGFVALSGTGVNAVFYNSNEIEVTGTTSATTFIGGSVRRLQPWAAACRNVAFVPRGVSAAATAFGALATDVGPANMIGCSIGDFPFVGGDGSTSANVFATPILSANSRRITTGLTATAGGFGYYSHRGNAQATQQARGVFTIPLGATDFNVPSGSFPFGNPGGFMYGGPTGTPALVSTNVRHGIRCIARNILQNDLRIRFHDLNAMCPVGRGWNTYTIPVGTTIPMTYNKYFESFLFDKLPDGSTSTKPTIVGARNEFMRDTAINNGAGWRYLAEPRAISQTFSLSGLISGNTLDLTSIVGATGQIADGWIDPTQDRPHPFSITLPLVGGGTVTFEADLGFPASYGAGFIYDNVDATNTRRIRISNTTRRTLDLTNDGVDVDATGNATINATIYPATGWFRFSPSGIEKVTTAQRTAFTADCLEGYQVFDTDLNAIRTLINGNWI